MNNVSDSQAKPWYKEFWAWFVFAPLIFIMGVCTVLLTVAYSLKDDVVSDDYYKKGRMINHSFAAERKAKELGLVAEIVINEAEGKIRVNLSGKERVFAPLIQLTFSHPMESGLDQSFELPMLPGASQPAVFETDIDELYTGRRYIRLSYFVDGPASMRTSAEPDPQVESWRIVGEAVITSSAKIDLAP